MKFAISAAASMLATALLAQAPTALAVSQVFGFTGPHQDSGNAFSRTVTKFVGREWDNVSVQLNGFKYVFMQGGDHDLKTVSARIVDQRYDAASGRVTFKVEGAFSDKRFNQDFDWTVKYTLLLLDMQANDDEHEPALDVEIPEAEREAAALERRLALIDRLEAEEIDPVWSDDTREAIVSRFDAGDDTHGVTLQAVECRSTWCRLDLEVADDAAVGRMLTLLPFESESFYHADELDPTLGTLFVSPGKPIPGLS